MTPQAMLDRPRGIPEISPREIADTVERYVRLRTGGTIRSLHVEVHDGEVLLSGLLQQATRDTRRTRRRQRDVADQRNRSLLSS